MQEVGVEDSQARQIRAFVKEQDDVPCRGRRLIRASSLEDQHDSQDPECGAHRLREPAGPQGQTLVFQRLQRIFEKICLTH